MDDLSVSDIKYWRELTKDFGQHVGSHAPVPFSDQKLPIQSGHSIKCRIFNGHLVNSPVFIFFPGCAFVFDFFEINSVICSRIAEKSGIKVILPQFRLAPENPMPASLQDSFDATHYIAENSKQFKIDRNKIMIGGWCSGAHASAYVSVCAAKSETFSIHHQICLSGSFDLSNSNRHFDDYESKDITLKRQVVADIAQLFYSMDSDKNPLFSPLWESNINGYPSTSILCGEFDALRNDSESYYHKLKSAKVDVDKVIFKGQYHNSIVKNLYPNELDQTSFIAEIIQSKL